MATTKVTGEELRRSAEVVLAKPNSANLSHALAIVLMSMADVVDKLDRTENDGR